MKLTYALLRKQHTHNLRYIVQTLLMKLAPGVLGCLQFQIVKNHPENSNDTYLMRQSTVVPQPLSNDPRFTQCIYHYSRASKRFVEVYLPC